MSSTSSDSPASLWALVDCNNFYASCERLFRPDLANRPVVVLSNNDGCIVSRSAEAKALGIPMPAFVYLIPAIPFFGIGKVSAVVATVVFSVPPAIRLTCLGIRQIPADLVECAEAFGLTRVQRLRKLELPLAMFRGSRAIWMPRETRNIRVNNQVPRRSL